MSSYHHGHLRSTLLEQGVELARAQGPEGVVLREVARRSGVSHNAAYRHFADRNALLAEIAEVGMQRLGLAMLAEMDQVALEPGPDRARARLRATGRAYVNFALAEPGLFAVAFASVDVQPDSSDLSVATQVDEQVSPHPYGLLGQALDELDAVGGMAPDRREGAEVLCWSAVHGYAVLHLDGPLHAVPEVERSAGLESLLDQIQRGLG
jgi:AcrR family transcriptional regulator